MTRAEFISRLRRGLIGLPASAIEEIVGDYESHFEDGLAGGRSEAEVAEALGNPDKLARDLRAEAGLKRWEEEKTPAAARGALWALLGLGVIDIIILTSVLLPVLGFIAAMFVLGITGIPTGAFLMATLPFAAPPGGPVVGILAGVGVVALSVSLTALTILICIGLVNALIWYAKVHYRLLKPAIDPSNGGE